MTHTTQNTTSTSNSKQDYHMDVIDHPSVNVWMKETAKRDPEGFILLVGPNVENFLKLYGEPEWQNNGNKGWTHGWKIYESNLVWNILTGPTGTIFRIRTTTPSQTYLNDPKVGVGIISYLTFLLKTLSN